MSAITRAGFMRGHITWNLRRKILWTLDNGIHYTSLQISWTHRHLKSNGQLETWDVRRETNRVSRKVSLLSKIKISNKELLSRSLRELVKGRDPLPDNRTSHDWPTALRERESNANRLEKKQFCHPNSLANNLPRRRLSHKSPEELNETHPRALWLPVASLMR